MKRRLNLRSTTKIFALIFGCTIFVAKIVNADNQTEIGPLAPQEHISESSNYAHGSAGTFVIKQIGVREGTFVFNGWNPVSDHFHVMYTVDAGVGGNVRLAIIQKVIEVIRKYKSGDFEMDSRRLGHQVYLSARPADDTALKVFLMKEFFDEDVTGK